MIDGRNELRIFFAEIFDHAFDRCENHKKIGGQEARDESGQLVVVAEFDFGEGDGVVFVDDRDNAVFEQADCVMLSGETTIGKYPVECVQMLDTIARRIEMEEGKDRHPASVFTGERMKVLHSAVVLANELPRSKLLTFTRHGFMAQGLAILRPIHSAILAFTPSIDVFRQLRLLRAVEPFLMPLAAEPNETIENAITVLRREGHLSPGDKLVIATDILAHDRLVDSVQLRTVQ